MELIDPKSDSRAFRAALGSFATGVTVVTAAGPDGPFGITANSFASVSLDPPLVLWSPAKDSRRYELFSTAETYAIHVLGGHQQKVCDAFTQSADAFDDVDWEESADGVPLIHGCLAVFECRRVAAHDAGDHLIIVGQVERAARRDGLPLLFQGGRFVSFKG
ncbi:flavin reductase family protein [Pelagovum pacificum]|uniref:Flavin reductase family protein n=1 Tax=Pelagovum pacificum TaxID=2588711 RepID=A0A5C5GIH2_9RHOB|nr:flavin reductase family protein [Pelagovum pacificum]QQA44931.1 flavin reductase family protein [Pelagovum pacificum]TNY34310.1 flavin reductase family protein [Pelagovum pacificum]